MKKKEKHPFREHKNEIYYNLINSFLAGGLVLLGSLTTGDIDKNSLLIAIGASLIVGLTKFKDYWDGEKKEFSTHMFSFIK
jgi:hypothetical protein